MKKTNTPNEQLVSIKKCKHGSLSISIEKEDYVVIHIESNNEIRFNSLRVANEFYETEVNK